jgi:hypothetical protein
LQEQRGLILAPPPACVGGDAISLPPPIAHFSCIARA